MKTLREQLVKMCRHFNGAPLPSDADAETRRCEAGVLYYDLMRIGEIGSAGCMCRIPCLGGIPGSHVRGQTVEACGQYAAFTEAEIQEKIYAIEMDMRALLEGLSPCCHAPIDHSQAITDGEFKGHGPRYCSNCHKLVFMV